jgi:hypothetical protein
MAAQKGKMSCSIFSWNYKNKLPFHQTHQDECKIKTEISKIKADVYYIQARLPALVNKSDGEFHVNKRNGSDADTM